MAVIVPEHSAERLAEIAEILAAGLIRLRARESTDILAESGDSSLDCAGHQSGHANPEIYGEPHG
jgi:hypothetical protein